MFKETIDFSRDRLEKILRFFFHFGTEPFLPVALYQVEARLNSVEDEPETMGAAESQGS